MLAEIDLMIRGAVIGISALTFAILVSNARTRRKSLSLGAVALATAGMMTKVQGISSAWSPQSLEPALFLSHFMPLALTWFVLDIFLDRPERRAVAGPLLCLSGVIVAMCFVPIELMLVHVSLTLVLFGALFFVVLRSSNGDLIEHRRSFRVVFILMVTVFGAIKTLTGAFLVPSAQPCWITTGFASTMLLFEVVFAYWALRPGGSLWSAEGTTVPTPRPAPDARVDTHLIARIEQAMADQLWRREGLSIGDMATELNAPEHRLRQTINRDLGYRNFPAFVNRYRIDAAKSALSAPQNADRAILEIAYDVGFASLGPFNRAFRADTGTSPRDYRRSADLDDGVAAQ